MIQPSYYPQRQTLRKLIYEYNQYEEIDLDEMLAGTQTNILGITIPDNEELYTFMYYTVLQKYMFAEIGYDTDEMFLSRLKAKWTVKSRIYHNILSQFFQEDSGFFSRIVKRNFVLEKDGNNTYAKAGTVTVKRDGDNTLTKTGTVTDEHSGQNIDDTDNTVTGHTEGDGQDTEYAVQTKTTEATNDTTSTEDKTETHTFDETNTVTNDTTDNTKIDETNTTTNDTTDTETIDETHTTTQDITEINLDPEKFTQYLKVTQIVDDFAGEFSSLFMQVFTNM